MENFNYNIPTKIYFGKGQIKVLGRQIKKYGSRVLLAYGGGSIKKAGIYDDVVKQLEENNIPYFELSGIEPNPKVSSVEKGVKICRDNDVDFILAVGGGSTIDCSKVIAASYYYNGSPWDLVIGKSDIKNVLPIGTVLTLSATGSEMDAAAVISNIETNQKYAFGHPGFSPKFSILDPTYTYTVSKYQTAAGVADIMSHVFESYFSNTKGAYIQDKIAEGILKTCIKYGPIALQDPSNYEARANLMWSAPLAINGLIGYGKNSEWSVHPLEHELSAYYDITHGVGLAILTPHWMEYVLNEDNLYKFVEYGVNVWNIDDTLVDLEIAKIAINKTREFFINIGIPMELKQVGIDEEKLEIMAKAVTDYNEGLVGNFKELNYDDVLHIFKKAF